MYGQVLVVEVWTLLMHGIKHAEEQCRQQCTWQQFQAIRLV